MAEQRFRRGDRFFVSNEIGKLRYHTDGTSAEIYLINRMPVSHEGNNNRSTTIMKAD
jgi:hypothetical protein